MNTKLILKKEICQSRLIFEKKIKIALFLLIQESLE